MIKCSNNNLAFLIEKHIKHHTHKEASREKIVKDLAEMVGDVAPHRMSGIMNGKYQMKLVDLIAIMKYFHLENVNDVVQIDFGTHKTFAALQKKLIAA